MWHLPQVACPFFAGVALWCVPLATWAIASNTTGRAFTPCPSSSLTRILPSPPPHSACFTNSPCREVPLYSSPAPDTNLMDYCTVEGEGSAQGGCSAYDVLKQMFDEVRQGRVGWEAGGSKQGGRLHCRAA